MSIAHSALEQDAPPPWYKQFWPWALIAIPASAVFFGFFMLWMAIKTWDGLVVDDYYKEGQAINQTLERSLEAARLGLAAQLRFSADMLEVDLLETKGPIDKPETLKVTVIHPTQPGHDQILTLHQKDGKQDGQYVAGIKPLRSGRWDILIEDETLAWRLKGSTHLPSETVLQILPYEPRN